MTGVDSILSSSVRWDVDPREAMISTVTLPPGVGAFLTQVTEMPDLEMALWKVLSEYINLKIGLIKQRIRVFESKWEMSFEEFSERCEAETLSQDTFAYKVESDFWEWERAETLLQHYEGLQTRWM